MDNNTSWNKECMKYSELAAKISMLSSKLFKEDGTISETIIFGEYAPIFRIALAKDPDLTRFLFGTMIAYRSEDKNANSAVVGMALSVMAYICNEKGKTE